MQSVLVLDDEALIAFDLAEVVRGSDRALMGPFMRIEDARKAVEGAVPDLALLDVNVRNETSWALAQDLLSQNCSVVFFSADERPNNLDEALAGCPFVRKPASHVEILNALNRA